MNVVSITDKCKSLTFSRYTIIKRIRVIKIHPGGFSSSSVIKNLPANAGDVGYILGLGRSPGEVNGNPLQYSCLGNAKDRGA